MKFCGIILNMSADVNLYHPVFSAPISLFILTYRLSSMVKAELTGTFLCHTTNILTCWFFYIVQWIKPPFLNFQTLHLTNIWNRMFTNNTLPENPFFLCQNPFSSDSFLLLFNLFWIDFIIALEFWFVNTIFLFLFIYFIIFIHRYYFQTFCVFIFNSHFSFTSTQFIC